MNNPTSVKDIIQINPLTPPKTTENSKDSVSTVSPPETPKYNELGQQEAIIKALPPRYQDLKPDQELYKKLKKQSLLLTGAVGSGKTRKLLEVLIAYLLENCKDRAPYYAENVIPINQKQIESLFLSVPMVLFKLKDEFDHPPQGQSLLEKMINAPVLFLDDLGAEKASEWVKEQLYLVINERYNWMRPVLLTTNLTIKEIAENYGDRFASRIVEMCETINYGGEDKRLKLKKTA